MELDTNVVKLLFKTRIDLMVIKVVLKLYNHISQNTPTFDYGHIYPGLSILEKLNN
jgi:hypothetical protein